MPLIATPGRDTEAEKIVESDCQGGPRDPVAISQVEKEALRNLPFLQLPLEVARGHEEFGRGLVAQTLDRLPVIRLPQRAQGGRLIFQRLAEKGVAQLVRDGKASSAPMSVRLHADQVPLVVDSE